MARFKKMGKNKKKKRGRPKGSKNKVKKVVKFHQNKLEKKEETKESFFDRVREQLLDSGSELVISWFIFMGCLFTFANIFEGTEPTALTMASFFCVVIGIPVLVFALLTLIKGEWELASFTGMLIFGFINLCGFLGGIVYRINWLPTLCLIFLGMELWFWTVDKKKPEKEENRLFFAAKRKLVGTGWISLILIQISGFSFVVSQSFPYLEKAWDTIKVYLMYLGIGAGILALVATVVVVFLWLNSLKYGGKK